MSTQLASKELWTRPELAKFLSTTERTIDSYMVKRVIPYIKLGRIVRFRRADVEKALEQHTIREANPKEMNTNNKIEGPPREYERPKSE